MTIVETMRLDHGRISDAPSHCGRNSASAINTCETRKGSERQHETGGAEEAPGHQCLDEDTEGDCRDHEPGEAKK